MATVTLKHVTKIYPPKKGKAEAPAVDNVSMAIKDEEIVALLGSSGCGKTTTLRMIAGFETVTEGTILVGEREVQDLQPAERNVAMAFEAYALYPPLKVRENIAFSLLRNRTPKAVVDKKIDHISKMLAIEGILDDYPPTLSGGQQQRVGLARALIRPAEIYLLDEAMSQLEPQLRAVLRARIKEFLIGNRMTTVFVTHDQTEAMAMADRIAVMSNGLLQQFDTPINLKERPAILFVAGFIGEPAMNLFNVRLQRIENGFSVMVLDQDGKDAFSFELPNLPALHKVLERKSLTFGIRPHRIHIAHNGNSGEASWVRGSLSFNQWLGDQSQIGVRFGGLTLLVVTNGDVHTPLNQPIDVGLPFAAMHFFDTDTGEALVHGEDLGIKLESMAA